MAYLGEEEINTIRQNANIVDIISSYIPLVQKGKDYKCVCPFHNDHSPSMSISTSKQIYKCFSCGAAGNVFTFVENFENVSFPEAIKIVADKIGYTINGTIETNNVSKYQQEYKLMELVTKYYQNNLATQNGIEAKKYLSSRGITENIINTFRIGVASDDYQALYTFLKQKNYDIKMLDELGLVNISNNNYYDTFARRITFPLWNTKGDVVGFSSRIYRGEEQAKYINTKETYIFKKGQNLFNYHNAKDIAKQNKSIIIVEGQMDAIRVYSSGIKNVVALMGTALTKEQIDLLKKLRCKVILCLDADEAGKQATLKNGDILIKDNIKVQVIRLSGAKDPDEYILKFGKEAYEKNIENAIDYFDFKMSALKENINEQNTEELTGYINGIIESLGEIDDPVMRELTINKLSEEYKINVEILKERLKKSEKVTAVAKEVFVKEKNKEKEETNLDKISKKVLFYMMNSPIYVKIFQKELGFFEKKEYRTIANLIIYYIGINNTINLADFITFSENNEEIKDVVIDIAQQEEQEINEENLKMYIKAIIKKRKEAQIQKLKMDLKNNLDTREKLEIAKRITEIKKGSV